MPATCSLSPVRTFTSTPPAASALSAAAADALGGSRKTANPAKVRPASSRHHRSDWSDAHRPTGDAEQPAALRARSSKLACSSVPPRLRQRYRATCARRLDAGCRARRTSSGAPLTIKQRSPPSSAQHRDAPALEVKRHLVDLAPGRRRRRCHAARMASSSGLFRPALEVAVQPREVEHPPAFGARRHRCAGRAAMRASVNVPVLSVQSTSIAPRLWIAAAS